MGIFLKHLWLIPNILKWQEYKLFTKLVFSLTPSRSSHRRCSVEKGIFKNLQNLLKFAKIVGVQTFRHATLLKRDFNTDVSLEICEIFKNNYFEEHLRTRSYHSMITPCCEQLLLSFLEFTKLKVGLSPSKKISFYLLQWKPFKNDENSFYFILKALFVLKIFKFLSWHFGHVEETA